MRGEKGRSSKFIIYFYENAIWNSIPYKNEYMTIKVRTNNFQGPNLQVTGITSEKTHHMILLLAAFSKDTEEKSPFASQEERLH